MSKRRTCAACWEAKDPEEYTKTQLSKGAKARRCKHCVDNKKEVRTDEAAAAKKAKVDSGNPTVQALSLDAAETAKATEKANVENSTVMAPTQPSSGAATPGATKPEEDNGNVVTPASNGKSSKNKLKVCCKMCNKSKKPSHFPKDYCSVSASKSSTCVACIFDAVDRTCQDCNETKPKEAFSSYQWSRWTPVSVQGGRLNGKKTVQDIEALAENTGGQLCLECYAIREEVARIAKLREEQKIRAVRKEHGIHWYDYDSVIPSDSPTPLSFSKTKPKDLLGEYDIVFHAGSICGEESQNVTTKGTVVLWEEKDDGTGGAEEEKQDGKLLVCGRVEFHEDMKHLSSCVHFQRDFELSEGSHSIDNDHDDPEGPKVWQCRLKARMTDERVADVVHFFVYAAGASLRCVEKRAALPWMQYDDEEDHIAEEFKGMRFATLEQAEGIAQQHERGPDCSDSWMVPHLKVPKEVAQCVRRYYKRPTPKPIFFLEPGDLVLHVNWASNFHEPKYTDCVLRKRLTKPSS